jgi:homospermidine synthase
MTAFRGRVFVVGCGSVAQCALPLLIKELNIEPSRITVMDFVDNRSRIADLIKQGVTYVQERITPENYAAVLKKYLAPGDIFIDLGWEMDTCALLQWCHDNKVRYINSSIELWNSYDEAQKKDPRELTLYARQMAIRKLMNSWSSKGSTAILDHGANPGLVSHFTKQALEDIANAIIAQKPSDPRVPNLKKYVAEQNFAQLAHLLGVKTIHISERDSQITHAPKKVNEFVNTWSIAGLYEEGIAPAELGWGTHEKFAPEGIMFHTDDGPRNQACLETKGMDTHVRSWVPSGEIIGMVIRHGEAFGISDRLTVWDNDTAIYRPTVHYAYCVSDSTLSSLHELKMRQLEMQPNMRILNDDILDGADELGCLLMGHDFKSWWIGSVLDIHQARKLVPNQSATTVQVGASIAAGVQYLMNHPEEGICLPDDLNHEEILAFAKPYLGTFISQPVDWSPLHIKKTFIDYTNKVVEPEDEWQFTSFLITPHKKIII